MRAAPPHLSHIVRSNLLLLRRRRPSARPPALLPPSPSISPGPSAAGTASACACHSLLRRFSSDSDFSDGILSEIRERPLLATEKPGVHRAPRSAVSGDLRSQISSLARELLALTDLQDLHGVLESSSAASLLGQSPDGSAAFELLGILRPRPLVALEFFNWRRKTLVEEGVPMLPEEYVKAITLAGRVKNVDLAADLFDTAGSDGPHTTSMYNALMASYMYNGLTKKCLALFEDLKRDLDCDPTIVTFNILLSVFGRSMLVDHMETILRAITDSKLTPTLGTYNTVIAGYVTAWMWDKMENTFQAMEDGPVKPDACTHLLMLRGYAHWGKLDKMEKTYEVVKERVDHRELPLIRAMICAYCKSSHLERIEKIEELARLLPDKEYRPWLNVLLIRVYAQEGLVERMESFISEAFARQTIVKTVDIMNSIISSYFRCNAVDRLAGFVSQAESAGWRLCRSLYHCKMVMYGKQSRFDEMKNVISEMEVSRFDPTKKTFWIMHQAYTNFGKRSEAECVFGLMWKHGFVIPEDSFLHL